MSKERKEEERKEHVAHEQVGNRRQEQETGTGWTRTAEGTGCLGIQEITGIKRRQQEVEESLLVAGYTSAPFFVCHIEMLFLVCSDAMLAGQQLSSDPGNEQGKVMQLQDMNRLQDSKMLHKVLPNWKMLPTERSWKQKVILWKTWLWLRLCLNLPSSFFLLLAVFSVFIILPTITYKTKKKKEKKGSLDVSHMLAKSNRLQGNRLHGNRLYWKQVSCNG